uniref:Uncharacterized protein n=1 Tax=Oryza brachyantha TaxID=4533 RepID=J3LEA7_ORYBR
MEFSGDIKAVVTRWLGYYNLSFDYAGECWNLCWIGSNGMSKGKERRPTALSLVPNQAIGGTPNRIGFSPRSCNVHIRGSSGSWNAPIVPKLGQGPKFLKVHWSDWKTISCTTTTSG